MSSPTERGRNGEGLEARAAASAGLERVLLVAPASLALGVPITQSTYDREFKTSMVVLRVIFERVRTEKARAASVRLSEV